MIQKAVLRWYFLSACLYAMKFEESKHAGSNLRLRGVRI